MLSRIVTLGIFLFWTVLWLSSFSLIGSWSEEEAIFLYEPIYVVRIDKGEDGYYPLYNDPKYGPSVAVVKYYYHQTIKTFSKPLPPKYSVEFKGKRFPLIHWLQLGPGYIYPRWIIFSVFKSLFGHSLLSFRISGLLVSLTTLLGIFIFCHKFFNRRIAIFSTALFSTVTFFFIFSIPADLFQYQSFTMCAIWSLLFLFLWRESKKNLYFVLFLIFVCFGISNHLRFLGFLASLSLALIILKIKLPLRYSHVAIFVLFLALTLSPYIMHSIDSPNFERTEIGWMGIAPVLEGDSFDAAKTIFSRFLSTFKTAYDIQNAISQHIESLLLNFDSKGVFTQLDFYRGSFKPSFIYFIPFLLGTITTLVLKNPFIPRLFIPLVILIYWLLSFVLTPSTMFTSTNLPWQYLGILPLFCISLVRFLDFLCGKGRFFMIFAYILFLLSSSLQVLQTQKILQMIRETTTHISAKAQRELVEYLKEKGIKNPLNLSSRVSLQAISEGEIQPFEYFTFLALNLEKIYEKLELILRMNIGQYAITGDLIPYSLLMKIASKSGVSIEKIASFPKGGSPVFTLIRINP